MENQDKRMATIKRKTAETDIEVYLELDPDDKSKVGSLNNISTGCGFLDHMLTLMASHGNFRMDVKCQGDTYVDYHHSVEDVGIALGEAFRTSLGDMKGIVRYGDIILPMDEALMICAVDISGRGMLGMDVSIPTEKIGDFDSELIKEFFIAFARKAEVTLHFKQLSGDNSHHIAESMFKAFGRVMAKAVAIDKEKVGVIPSTKGVL